MPTLHEETELANTCTVSVYLFLVSKLGLSGMFGRVQEGLAAQTEQSRFRTHLGNNEASVGTIATVSKGS